MPEPRWSRLLRRPAVLGIVLGAWFFGESLDPSLLVRSWLFQGVLAGLSLAMGYGIGLGLTRLGRYLRTRFDWPWHPLSPTGDRRMRLVVLALVLIYVTWAVLERGSRAPMDLGPARL